VQHAARDTGWVTEAIVPAYSAWAALAAQRRVGSLAGARGRSHPATRTVVIPRADDGINMMTVTGLVPTELRRFRAEDTVVASEMARDAIRVESPAEAAAQYAPRTRTLELITDDIRAQRRAATRRHRMMGVAAVVGVCILGMVGMVWHAEHQLTQLGQQRAALRSRVDTAARLQSTLATLAAPANTLARIEEHGVQWSAVISELSETLPPDAYIEGLRAVNDSIAIDGAAGNGARAIQSVAAGTLLTHVVPSGPIRRDEGGIANAAQTDAVERFTLLARVANAARLVPAPTRKAASSRATPAPLPAPGATP
jgi:Tfp pilus assembly protein PilN